ncbi:MAG: hypothetical protein K9G67_08025 [Bacteroidales bacterium]|nr:hypothetical protein [Bacteroidales bacterium]MCF8345281.1 hypothetical protein [Bacteroidales bacterium]MCF8349767.1 hypothetical protein [Bacteroidales bacterium]MCF8376286.1 hypothetical protein [Bacteroidales bacterium]MCF8401581.1 hypothetical protein [Bacteroidales bacterium]
MKWIFLLPLLLWVNLHAVGQDIPEINEKELTAYSITRNETFDGLSLWGYMNGGADIYLEYGFDVLRVQEFQKNGEQLKLELFKMDDPLSAFGIYSIKIFKCNDSPLLTSIDCLNPYQYQILHGNYYIQIINESGSDKAKALMIEIAGAILQKPEAEKFVLPATYLTDSLKLSPADIKMLKGPLGLIDKAPGLTDLLEGLDDYEVYYTIIERDDRKQKLYEIFFEEQIDKQLFKEKHPSKGYQIIKEKGNSLVLQKI